MPTPPYFPSYRPILGIISPTRINQSIYCDLFFLPFSSSYASEEILTLMAWVRPVAGRPVPNSSPAFISHNFIPILSSYQGIVKPFYLPLAQYLRLFAVGYPISIKQVELHRLVMLVVHQLLIFLIRQSDIHFLFVVMAYECYVFHNSDLTVLSRAEWFWFRLIIHRCVHGFSVCLISCVLLVSLFLSCLHGLPVNIRFSLFCCCVKGSLQSLILSFEEGNLTDNCLNAHFLVLHRDASFYFP